MAVYNGEANVVDDQQRYIVTSLSQITTRGSTWRTVNLEGTGVILIPSLAAKSIENNAVYNLQRTVAHSKFSCALSAHKVEQLSIRRYGGFKEHTVY